MKKIVKIFIGIILGSCVGFIVRKNIRTDEKCNSGDLYKKFKEYYNILNQWLYIKNSGKSIEQILLNNNIKSIAIYGLGEIGTRLIEELENTEILIKYGIDNNVQKINAQIEVFNSNELWSMVDAIVITAVFDYDNIKEIINKKGNYKILSIKDIVFNTF